MYKIIDLKELLQISMVPAKEIDAWCPSCEMERISQDMNKCPACDVTIIWEGSKIWRNKFGQPSQVKQQLNAVVPDDEASYLCKLAAQPGLRGPAEANRWTQARIGLSAAEVRKTIDYCKTRSRGRGLVLHVINALAAQERKTERSDEITW